MGNGPRVALDIETSELSEDLKDLEDMINKNLANFGPLPQANTILGTSSAMWTNMWSWDIYPKYKGTPWSEAHKLSKREKCVAELHTFLFKLDILKNISKDNFKDITRISHKRLKRAKWARYQRKGT